VIDGRLHRPCSSRPIKACRGSTCKRPVVAGNEWSQYLGTFTGKHETRHAVADPVDIYQHDAAILKRIAELAAMGRVMRPSNAPDPDPIRLLPLRGEARLAGAANVEPGLNVALVQRSPGGQPSTKAPIAGP
jgi:hypothetical protein